MLKNNDDEDFDMLQLDLDNDGDTFLNTNGAPGGGNNEHSVNDDIPKETTKTKRNARALETKASLPIDVPTSQMKAGSMNTTTTTAPRTIRDLAFKPRFINVNGYDEELYEEAKNYINNWSTSLFYVDEKRFKDIVANGSHKSEVFQLVDESLYPKGKTKEIEQLEFDSEFGNLNEITVTLKKEGASKSEKLLPGQIVSLRDSFTRNAFILNVGGYVTSSSWLPCDGLNNEFTYLAVSVINIASQKIQDLIIHPELSILGFKGDAKEVNSSIQIWRYEFKTQQFQLSTKILTNKFGVTSNLSWAKKNFKTTNVLGLLLGSFSDGKLHVFEIPRNEGDCNYLVSESPSITYEVKDDLSSKKHSTITCYSLLENDSIVVGTADGYLAEFILPRVESPTSNSADEGDISIPSFIELIADSAICSIATTNPKPYVHMIYLNTLGTQAYTFIYENRRFHSERMASVSLAPLKSHHHLRLFFGVDGHDTLAYSQVKSPQERPILAFKTENITSYGISEHLGHPLALIGNSFGEAYIVNFARKLLNNTKTSNKVLIPLRLWKFEKNSNNGIDLIGDYVSTVAEKPIVKVSTADPELNISSISWCEDLQGSSMYAMSTISGLLLVERLDPST